MARKGRLRLRRLVDAVARSHPSLDDPLRLIVRGHVLVDGRVVDNPASLVRGDAVISIRQERPLRGEAKLTAALEQFEVAAAARIALDLGAAAGGFKKVLLRKGAAKVYAVDAGFGQLLDRSGRIRGSSPWSARTCRPSVACSSRMRSRW
jgi:predicted rRNA methylase YqxC with S4 and FtsJ domains